MALTLKNHRVQHNKQEFLFNLGLMVYTPKSGVARKETGIIAATALIWMATLCTRTDSFFVLPVFTRESRHVRYPLYPQQCFESLVSLIICNPISIVYSNMKEDCLHLTYVYMGVFWIKCHILYFLLLDLKTFLWRHVDLTQEWKKAKSRDGASELTAWLLRFRGLHNTVKFRSWYTVIIQLTL